MAAWNEDANTAMEKLSGGSPMLRGAATLTQRLDHQIMQLEEHLARLKQAREVLARNPDYEFLADSLRHL